MCTRIIVYYVVLFTFATPSYTPSFTPSYTPYSTPSPALAAEQSKTRQQAHQPHVNRAPHSESLGSSFQQKNHAASATLHYHSNL